MKNITDLLDEELQWHPVVDSQRDFYCLIYSTEICRLRMNDFPEEPLWTLFYESESLDFDDTPQSWKIEYRK